MHSPRIRSNGKHLLGLINTVLDIAKIESGQFTLNLAEYALENVVETVRAATEALAKARSSRSGPTLPSSFRLASATSSASPRSCSTWVHHRHGQQRPLRRQCDRHRPGIPEEHQARIFEQFHQVDSSNTKAKGGTGLGFAIAKQIVEMHGGRIWVESTKARPFKWSCRSSRRTARPWHEQSHPCPKDPGNKPTYTTQRDADWFGVVP